jgi:CHAT domain-containing protein
MIKTTARVLAAVLILIVCVIGFGYLYKWQRRHSSNPRIRLRELADEKAWLNDWIGASPLYQQLEQVCETAKDDSCVLYARVSQIPPRSETLSLPDQIRALTQDLDLPSAQSYDTHLRILSVRGMLEVNYDAAMTRKTYSEIEKLAWQRGRFLVAARAIGEQGIAEFLSGNIQSAKRKVIYAWSMSKVFRDRAAQIRYASLYAEGLIQVGRFAEARKVVTGAIDIAAKTPGAPYPGMARAAEMQSLAGLKDYDGALRIAAESEAWAKSHSLFGQLVHIENNRADIYEKEGKTDLAINAYRSAIAYSKQIAYWRGVSEVGGSLAQALEKEEKLDEALAAVNDSLDANAKIPDELYFVPRNLAVKADILRRMGRIAESNDNYQKSTTLIDSLLMTSPSLDVERLLLADLSDVYSGYFVSLSEQGRREEAFELIEKAHGRIEAQSLEHHETKETSEPTAQEKELTELNVRLLRSDDPAVRNQIEQKIYDTELNGSSTSPLASQTSIRPVSLDELQKRLHDGELLLEYVLGEPSSYVMAVTHDHVSNYKLAGKGDIERDCKLYRSAIAEHKALSELGSGLFRSLLGQISELSAAATVIIVADGELHLLPFSALWDGQHYVVQTHSISTAPSATVLNFVRSANPVTDHHTFVGVAAWTGTPTSWLDRARHKIFRQADDLELKNLEPLPASLDEVTHIASDLPSPKQILAGVNATEREFKSLPLVDYKVLHLALHGHVDEDYPDRSALVFAPENDNVDDGLLQLREIRNLHLTASLVTLSACNSGVGPVGEAGVDNLANAFLDAGAATVVSSLWEVDDRATSDLMISFYDHLAHGEGKAQALREAKIHLMQGEASQPFYWAAFEISGEPATPLPVVN